MLQHMVMKCYGVWLMRDESPRGCDIWNWTWQEGKSFVEIRIKSILGRGDRYCNICKWETRLVFSVNKSTVSKGKGRTDSDIFVVAYGSDFKAYPPSSYLLLILCLCPCHWNQMINDAFYGYSGKYIILDFYWAQSTESMPFQSPVFWWRNIVIYSK